MSQFVNNPEHTFGFDTLQLHVGQESADPASDARAVPIYQTTSYVFRNSQHAADRFGLADAGNIYGRLTNSTQGVFEDRIAALEGGVAGLAVASGAAAITYTLQALAQQGDHVVAQKTIYGGSYNLLAHTLSQFGVTTTFVDAHNLEEVEGAIHDNTTVINLGYADVFYALDMKGVDRTISFVNGVDAREVRARGLVYSSLGMNSCSVSELPSNQGGFRMTYSLFNGWSVVLDEGSYSGATATLAGNAITLTLESGNLSAVAYPMGVATITCGDLAKMTEMNGWAVTLTGLPAGDGVVEDIGSIGVSVTGYLGSDTDAELSRDMRYRGIGFEVTSVALTASTAGNLQNLTVGDGIPIGKDSFTALSGLRSVKADYVSEVGDGAFRFCTSLKEVSFASCSRFGAYAFESCWSLESVNLGSGDISFGEDALRGCRALKILTVGMDTSIEGADDVIVLHYDTSDSNVKAFEVHGDFVLVTWWYGRTIEYSGTDDRTAAESMDFYYGSPNPTTVIPASDEMYVWVSTGPLNTSGRILVVFDYGLGVGYDTQRILTGTAASDPGARAHLGYHFQYWTLDGTNPFDFGTRLVQSTVLTAVWSKDDPVDPTPLYLGAILVASVIATFAVLAVGRRKH